MHLYLSKGLLYSNYKYIPLECFHSFVLDVYVLNVY